LIAESKAEIKSSMKRLFSVTFSAEEAPYCCVATNESHALGLTMEYAAGWELPISTLPTVEVEGAYPDFDDFERRYSLRHNPYDPIAGLGGKLFGAQGAEWKLISQSSERAVWTLLESDGVLPQTE
jgi:hypothetical protein